MHTERSMQTMRPLLALSGQACRGLRWLLCDIDDTVTTEGSLPAASLAAMEQLREAGVEVVPITGRPAGWCDHIARMWPVTAVVGENGALYFRYDAQNKKMIRVFFRDDATRREDRARLDELRAKILAAHPGAGIASDQPYREADLAIDFCEDVPALPRAEVRAIAAMFEQVGAKAKISSIHVNGWFGDYDKLAMTRRLFREQLGAELADVQHQCVFAGDSPNDAPMFAAFQHSVGVANVLDFVDDLEHRPAHVTPARSGDGFAQLCAHILRCRADGA